MCADRQDKASLGKEVNLDGQGQSPVVFWIVNGALSVTFEIYPEIMDIVKPMVCIVEGIYERDVERGMEEEKNPLSDHYFSEY